MLIERLNSFPTVSCCFQTLKERSHFFHAEHHCTFALYKSRRIVLYAYSRQMPHVNTKGLPLLN